MTKKTIPDSLRAAKHIERNETVEAFDKAMDAIRRDLESGKLARKHKKIFMADVVARTGKGEEILKGKAHKDTTRKVVRKFVTEVNKALEEMHSDNPETEILALKQELREVRDQRQRALDTANDWSRRVREKNVRIHNLETLLAAERENLAAEREKNRSKVVHIVRGP
ncbi:MULTISPECIES: hypothetical protein [Rhizobium]|uniref:hypothetical protein n=1 Tax=Rhizobium TaxID=379 RepID=UPI00036B098F|nr:hypothetical protein [Rhizobium leguminosarum]NKK11429.1 hypothetical protein [Rhizobium leguminosarum bv. viciae]NKK25388.1 hypothetical protein [Rhizobium leguminosarum bv. viciae]